MYNRCFVGFLLLLLILCGSQKTLAQSNDSISSRYNFQIEFKPSYGFLITHHQEMNLFRSHFPLFEISLQNSTYGRSYWQSRLNYPAVGISFLYSGLGEMPEIGRVFALYPYLSFNFLNSQKNQLNLKMGIGASVLTNKFDPKENPKNTFIGSYVNAVIHLSLEYNRFITERLSVSAFIGLTHCSNGARRAPNNGINIAHAGLSTKYFIREPHKRIPKESIDKHEFKDWNKKNISYYFALTYAAKDIDEYMGYGKTWSVFNLQINTMKRLSKVSKIGIGFDLVYDNTDKEILKFKDIEYNDFEIFRTGINIAYEIVLDQTSFMVNFGSHLSGKELGEGYLYQKICAMQNLGKHIFVTCALTTHFGWADFFSFGVGYRIN